MRSDLDSEASVAPRYRFAILIFNNRIIEGKSVKQRTERVRKGGRKERVSGTVDCERQVKFGA